MLLCTLLPGAAPALVRESGAIWLGLQVRHAYGDPSRDLAAVLDRGRARPSPGASSASPRDPGEGPRLQDLVEGDLEVTVHDGFDFWLADVEDEDGSMAAALEQANARRAADPAPGRRRPRRTGPRWGSASTSAGSAPRTRTALLDALARLHAAREDRLVEGARLIGMFRAHGVLVPVWDVPAGTGAEALAEPAAAFDALLERDPGRRPTAHAAERSARSGLASRQLTIH